jgi:hypothetical protein
MKIYIQVLLVLLALSLNVRADTRIKVLVNVTNLPEQGNTFTLNGNTRTWTTSASPTSIQIKIGTNSTESATNFYNYIVANPFIGNLTMTYTNIGALFIGAPNVAMSGSKVGSWGVITTTTNASYAGTPATVPFDTFSLGGTNLATRIIDGLNSFATNKINAALLPEVVASGAITNVTSSSLTVTGQGTSVINIESSGSSGGITNIASSVPFLSLTGQGTLVQTITTNTTKIPAGNLDSTVVINSRSLSAGLGLTGGGDLSSDRTIAINPSIVLTNGMAVSVGSVNGLNPSEFLTNAFSALGLNVVGSGHTRTFSINPSIVLTNGMDISVGTVNGLTSSHIQTNSFASLGLTVSGSGNTRTFAINPLIVLTNGMPISVSSVNGLNPSDFLTNAFSALGLNVVGSGNVRTFSINPSIVLTNGMDISVGTVNGLSTSHFQTNSFAALGLTVSGSGNTRTFAINPSIVLTNGMNVSVSTVNGLTPADMLTNSFTTLGLTVSGSGNTRTFGIDPAILLTNGMNISVGTVNGRNVATFITNATSTSLTIGGQGTHVLTIESPIVNAHTITNITATGPSLGITGQGTKIFNISSSAGATNAFNFWTTAQTYNGVNTNSGIVNNGQTTVNGGLVLKRVTKTDHYTNSASDYMISWFGTVVAQPTNSLPATPPDGTTYLIKDAQASASTTNIVIKPLGSDTIGRSSSTRLMVNDQAITITYNSTTGNWEIH